MGAHKRIVGDYTITTLGGNITANGRLITSSGIFWSNGSAYSSGAGGSSYGNADVASYLPTYSGNLASPSISGNLTVYGNLYVNGNTTTVNTNTFIVNDNIIYMANANPANSLDIGFAGHFTSGTYQHTGLVRQASSGQWKLFSNVSAEPGNTIDFTNAVYDAIQVGNIASPTITDLYANAAAQLSQITGANAAIVTANTAMKGYVDAANTIQSGQITTLQGQVYANSNVAAYLPTYSGNIGAGNVNTTSIYGTNYLYSNGVSILTGIVGSSSYSNANVVANLLNLTTNVTTSANVNASYFTGNAYYMTGVGLGSTYGNANVIAYLTSTYANANIGSYSPTFSTGNLVYGTVPIVNLSSATAVGASPTLIDSFPTASYRTAKYIVSVADNTNSEFQSSELIVVHNGTTANVSSYGLVYSNVTARMAFTTNISAGNVNLWGTGVSISNTVKLSKTLIPV